MNVKKNKDNDDEHDLPTLNHDHDIPPGAAAHPSLLPSSSSSSPQPSSSSSSSSTGVRLKKLFRPKNTKDFEQWIHEDLLERYENLTDGAITEFLGSNGSKRFLSHRLDNDKNESYHQTAQEEVQAYRNRRKELFALTQMYRNGTAHIDADGRLVADATSSDVAPPNAPLPPLPPPPPPAVPQNRGGVGGDNNNNQLPFNNNNNNVNWNEDEQELDERWLREQEQEATAAIARAMERYQQQQKKQQQQSNSNGGPDDPKDALDWNDFELILLPPVPGALPIRVPPPAPPAPQQQPQQQAVDARQNRADAVDIDREDGVSAASREGGRRRRRDIRGNERQQGNLHHDLSAGLNQIPQAVVIQPTTNFTFRRICCAVMAVVLAFVVIMLHTIPTEMDEYGDANYDYDTASGAAVVESESAEDGTSHTDGENNMFGFQKSSKQQDSQQQQQRRRRRPPLDPLMHKVLQVRHAQDHILECHDLLHRSNTRSWQDHPLLQLAARAWKLVPWRRWTVSDGADDTTMTQKTVDCSDGVLHLPHPSSSAMLSKEGRSIYSFSFNLDHTWFLKCHPVPNEDENEKINESSAKAPVSSPLSCLSFDQEKNKDESKCLSTFPSTHAWPSETQKCFRGVHDGFLSKREIASAMLMGAQLISMGADHFDIHYDVAFLEDKVPSIVFKLQKFLIQRYKLRSTIHPVAFRVDAAGPMDGTGVPMFEIYDQANQHPLVRILNRTNYLHWMDQSSRRNELAQYSLPWPLRIRPVRDTCNLMADLEADPRFAVHTSIFLSDGANHDFRGGAALYVDYDDDQYLPDPRRYLFSRRSSRGKKIQRGLSVDGAKGRLIVSTGGLENRRCRMPTRAGVRAVLQIWWSC